ncbi:MAG: holo-ACP synthase [Treponema sp.]|nr:holo-ACP synthase [Treponema sp.]
MIFGVGCDIARISRFAKWVESADMLRRFFNEKEFFPHDGGTLGRRCEYYAARFAAKEAFSKALGTGLQGFSLTDVYVQKDDAGKPSLCVSGRAADALRTMCGEGCSVHLSLSHEKEYAVAFVVIECR